MTQTNCPRCDSARLQYQENYGYWECDDCGHTWGFDADDPDYDEEQLDLGACCACGCTGETVRNLIMLQKKAPVPGTGWGCLVCGVPSDGAVAVVCNDCLARARLDKEPDVIKEVIYGYPTEKRRYSLAALTEFLTTETYPTANG